MQPNGVINVEKGDPVEINCTLLDSRYNINHSEFKPSTAEITVSLYLENISIFCILPFCYHSSADGR